MNRAKVSLIHISLLGLIHILIQLGSSTSGPKLGEACGETLRKPLSDTMLLKHLMLPQNQINYSMSIFLTSPQRLIKYNLKKVPQTLKILISRIPFESKAQNRVMCS